MSVLARFRRTWLSEKLFSGIKCVDDLGMLLRFDSIVQSVARGDGESGESRPGNPI